MTSPLKRLNQVVLSHLKIRFGNLPILLTVNYTDKMMDFKCIRILITVNNQSTLIFLRISVFQTQVTMRSLLGELASGKIILTLMETFCKNCEKGT